MSLVSILLGIAVGIINIIMNILVKKATEVENRTYLNSIFSLDFLYAFLVGILSITVVFTFYYYSSKFNFAQALILMGASSICIGTLYGYFYRNNTLSTIDIIVFLVIVISYSYKYISVN